MVALATIIWPLFCLEQFYYSISSILVFYSSSNSFQSYLQCNQALYRKQMWNLLNAQTHVHKFIIRGHHYHRNFIYCHFLYTLIETLYIVIFFTLCDLIISPSYFGSGVKSCAGMIKVWDNQFLTINAILVYIIFLSKILNLCISYI